MSAIELKNFERQLELLSYTEQLAHWDAAKRPCGGFSLKRKGSKDPCFVHVCGNLLPKRFVPVMTSQVSL